MTRPRVRRLRYAEDPIWASLTEAAGLLHVSAKTVARMIDSGELRGERISDADRSHRRVLRAALAGRAAAGGPPAPLRDHPEGSRRVPARPTRRSSSVDFPARGTDNGTFGR